MNMGIFMGARIRVPSKVLNPLHKNRSKMKIAILSDIHDHVWNLEKALAHPLLQETEAMLFCGDLCAPFIVHLLGKAYSKPTHLVLGNNDGDVAAIIANAAKYPNVRLHGEYYRGSLGGITIAVNHYPDNARALAENGGYDVVCYGHNHTIHTEKVNDTLLLNPGAIMGYHGGELRDLPATFLVLETSRMQVTRVDL